MANKDMANPNLSWPLFEINNSHKTKAFELMCLDLFTSEFVQEGIIPHTNHNNPGLETDPVPSPAFAFLSVYGGIAYPLAI